MAHPINTARIISRIGSTEGEQRLRHLLQLDESSGSVFTAAFSRVMQPDYSAVPL
jgi:hypothetical protein